MTTTNPLTAARNAVVAAWTANWAGSEPVLWQQNAANTITPGSETPLWLHAEVEHMRERAVAFGGGPRNAERVLYGALTLHAFALVGAGEDAMLDLLDRATSALRGRAIGSLTIYCDVRYSQPGESDDEMWCYRAATLSYKYRFSG